MGWLSAQVKLSPEAGRAAADTVLRRASNSMQRVQVLQRSAPLGPEVVQSLVDQLPPGEGSTWPVLQVQAGAWLGADRFAEALDAVQVALKQTNTPSAVRVVLRTVEVRCQARLGNAEGGRVAAESLLREGEGQPMALLAAGDRFLEWQMPDAAEQVYATLVGLKGPTADVASQRMAALAGEAFRMRAVAHLEAGRPQDALAAVREGRERPAVPAGLRVVYAGIEGVCGQRLGQTDLVAEAKARLLAEANADPNAVVATAGEWLAQGMTREAVSVWTALAEREGAGRNESATQLLRLAESARDGAGMRRWAEHILKSDPTNPGARQIVALMNLLAGPDAAAIAEAERLHAGASNQVAVAGTWALALWRAGRPAESLAVIEGLPPVVRNQPGSRLRRALALDALGRRDEARELVRGVGTNDVLREAVPLLEQVQSAAGPVSGAQ
jgi:hypothetical protein